jgi:hypothetical protein
MAMDGDLISLVNKLQYAGRTLLEGPEVRPLTNALKRALSPARDTFNAIGGDPLDLCVPSRCWPRLPGANAELTALPLILCLPSLSPQIVVVSQLRRRHLSSQPG